MGLRDRRSSWVQPVVNRDLDAVINNETDLVDALNYLPRGEFNATTRFYPCRGKSLVIATDFVLSSTIRLTEKHSGLTIRGSGARPKITCSQTNMFSIEGATQIAFADLEFSGTAIPVYGGSGFTTSDELRILRCYGVAGPSVTMSSGGNLVIDGCYFTGAAIIGTGTFARVTTSYFGGNVSVAGASATGDFSSCRVVGDLAVTGNVGGSAAATFSAGRITGNVSITTGKLALSASQVGGDVTISGNFTPGMTASACLFGGTITSTTAGQDSLALVGCRGLGTFDITTNGSGGNNTIVGNVNTGTITAHATDQVANNT